MGEQRSGTWEEFAQFVCRWRFAPKGLGGSVALGEFADGHRLAAKSNGASIVGLDFDGYGAERGARLCGDLEAKGLSFVAHTTHSGLDNWRFFLPLTEVVMPRFWPDFWRWIHGEFPGLDVAAKDISRGWYLPTTEDAEPMGLLMRFDGAELVPKMLEAPKRKAVKTVLELRKIASHDWKAQVALQRVEVIAQAFGLRVEPYRKGFACECPRCGRVVQHAKNKKSPLAVLVFEDSDRPAAWCEPCESHGSGKGAFVDGMSFAVACVMKEGWPKTSEEWRSVNEECGRVGLCDSEHRTREAV